MLAGLLYSSFLDKYSLCLSSLGCKAFCIVINVLVLWYICLSSFLFHFNNIPEYLTTTQVLISFMIFLLQSVDLRSLVHLRHSFLNFSFISACLMVSTSDITKYLQFSFSPSVPILSFFFFWQCCFPFPTFHSAWHIFQCQIPFLYLDPIGLLFVSRSPVLFHFFHKQLDIVLTWSLYQRWRVCPTIYVSLEGK